MENKLSYADIINPELAVITLDGESVSEQYFPSETVYEKRKRNLYNKWKTAYSEYVWTMRDIFARGYLILHPKQEEYIYSEEFLEIFSKYIFSVSSGKIN